MLDEIAQAHWVSATQVGTYRLCKRKWGWNKLDYIKVPPNRFAERGSRVHGVGERWLETGKAIDMDSEEGRIFSAGIKFLPPPGSGLVENQFTFSTNTAVYIGLWDLFIPVSEQYFKKKLLENGVPIVPVYDHKTTTDFKWMKTAAELRTDPQMIIYGVAAAAGIYQRWEIVPVLVLTWIYYRANANKPGARRVQLVVVPDKKLPPPRPDDIPPEYFGVMDYSELMEQFADIESTAAELLEHRRQGHKARDLDYNVAGCNALGGCPYRGGPCELSFGETIRGHMEQKSLVERATAARQGTSTSAGDAGGAAAGQEELPNLAARMEAHRAKGAKEEADPAVVAGAEAAVAKTAAEVQAGAPQINPPGEAAAAPPAQEPAPSSAAPPKAAARAVELAGEGLRLELAAEVAGGVAAARLYNHTSPSYPEDVGTLALEVADAIIEAAKK